MSEAARLALTPVDQLSALVSPHEYACARAVYRWDQFAYHYGSEFELSEEDFKAAVQAAYTGTALVESAKPKG